MAGLENAAIYGRFGSPAEVLDPELCRFSDAGNDEARQTLGGRRLKSAKARNAGFLGTPVIAISSSTCLGSRASLTAG